MNTGFQQHKLDGKDTQIWGIHPRFDETSSRAPLGAGSDFPGETTSKGSQSMPHGLHPQLLRVGMPSEGLDCCWFSDWDAAGRAMGGFPGVPSLTFSDFVDVDVKTQHGRAQHEGHPRPDDGHGEQDACGDESREGLSHTRRDHWGHKVAQDRTMVHNTFLQCRLFPKQLSDLPPLGIYPIYGDNKPVLSRAPFAGKVLQNSNLSCYFPPAP